jgi:endonuclease-8
MPEGDTIRKLALALRPDLEGMPVDAMWTRRSGEVPELVGQRVETVEAIGKHLLLRFEGDLGFRAHLGMSGSVHRYRPGESWRKARDRAVATLTTTRLVFVFFDAAQAEILDTRRIETHPRLSKLGPDLLADEVNVEEIIRRARESEAPTVAELLLDQRVAAGVGNVYKSEVLFLERVDPFASPRDLDPEALARLFRRAGELLEANVVRGPRATVPASLREAGYPRLWVYDRRGRPCLRCGTAVARRHHGDANRATFFCARCQRAES